MKKTLLFALALAAVCIIPSCEKETNGNGQGEEPVANKITFGDYEGMDVVIYDTILHMVGTLSMDLDQDGIDDLKVESRFEPSYEGQTFDAQILNLYCLNESIALFGETVENESYIHQDTFITDDEGLTIVSHLLHYSTCEKEEDDDEVILTNAFVATANAEGGALSTTDNFLSEHVVLFRENIDIALEPITSSDTIYNSTQTYDFSCDNYETNTMTYIGFKLTRDGQSRLGWLKIYLSSNFGNVVHTEIHETAIQR
jgi:hypothetical protein